MEVLGSLTKEGRSAFVRIYEVDENSNVNVNDEIIVNTISSVITITLPTIPKEGDFLEIHRVGTHDVIINRNGSTILGAEENLILDVDRYGVRLRFVGDTWTWPTGDRPMYLGKCTFVLPVDLGTGLWSKTDNINSMLRSTGDNIYGYLVTVAGYTPANNSEVYVPTLYCTQV